jgi:glycosyltransferase involved in cell wall biosynthesis
MHKIGKNQTPKEVKKLHQEIKQQIDSEKNKYAQACPNPKAKKVVCYRGDKSACWYYRIHAPFSYVNKKHPDDYFVHITSLMDKGQLGFFKLAVLQRQYKADVFAPMLTMKEMGIKVVYEIDDDLFGVPKWSPAYSVYGKKSVKENLKYFLSNVDAVFVTNEYLADVYSPYCEKIYILPNSIDKSIMSPSPGNSEKKVVCWQGSHTHDKDISIMKPALQRLNQDEDTCVKLWSIDVPGIYKVPAVPFEAFYPMFSQIDGYVGLAPVTTIPFNRGKSNLKFLEYTAQGMVTVASNFGPYAETIEHDVTGLLIDNNKEWYDAVRYLIDDEDAHQRILANAQAFVDEHYDMQKNYVYWKDAVDELLGEEND